MWLAATRAQNDGRVELGIRRNGDRMADVILFTFFEISDIYNILNCTVDKRSLLGTEGGVDDS